MRIKKLIVNFSLLIVSVGVCLVLCEFIYRALLFGDNPKFSSWRKPDLYADYFNDDDYWKLYHIFGGEYGPPKDPHPLLGWIGKFNRETYIHDSTNNIKNRRPVLLLGD